MPLTNAKRISPKSIGTTTQLSIATAYNMHVKSNPSSVTLLVKMGAEALM